MRLVQSRKYALLTGSFFLVVLLLTLAGVALTFYTLYDTVQFKQTLDTRLAAVSSSLDDSRASVALVTNWTNDNDCSITTDAWYLARPPCACTNATGVWQCPARSSNATADCAISGGRFCSCSIVGVGWAGGTEADSFSCARERNDVQINDAGLRFIPPGAADALRSPGAPLALFAGATAMHERNYYAVLATVSTVSSATPTLAILFASLSVELVGLVLLIAGALYHLLLHLDVVAVRTVRCCGGRKVKVGTLTAGADIVLFSVGLMLFGALLVVAFTDPIEQTARGGLVSLTWTPDEAVTRGGQGPVSLTGRPALCNCEGRECACVGGEAVYSSATTFRSTTQHATSVVVTGDCVVDAPVLIAGSLRVVGGSLTVLRGPLAIMGTLHVDGSLGGAGWLTDAVGLDGHHVGGDAWVGGDMRLERDANLSGFQGLLTVAGTFSAAGSLALPTVASAERLPVARGLVHARNVTVGGPASVRIAAALFPVPVFGALSVEAPGTLSYSYGAVDHVWVAQNQCAGARTAAVASPLMLALNFTATCGALPPLVLPAYEQRAAMAVSAGSAFEGEGRLFAGAWAFRHTNCGSWLDVRLERAYVHTLRQSNLPAAFWEVCDDGVVDEAALCITYTCRGTLVPPRSSDTLATLQTVQSNVIEGVVLDGIITGLDLAAVLLEYMVLPLVASGFLARNLLANVEEQ